MDSKYFNRARLILLCSLLLPAGGAGADFYVASSGSSSGNGSMNSPWDILTALAHPSAVRPGDTINLRAGTYRTSGGVFFVSRLTGTASQPITVRPYQRERVVIDGGVQIVGPGVIFRDLEVMSSDPRRVSTQPTTWPTDVNQYVGFASYAANVKLINNIIHDESSGINGWIQGSDNEYYGNIIFYNGWQQGQYNAHGHGMYIQNKTGFKKVRDNIVFDQFDHGIHVYGSANSALDNVELDGNISFGNGMLGMYYTRNILVGGGIVARNPVITNNYTYFSPRSTLGGENNVGYAAGCTNLRLTGNYWVSDGYAINLNGCTVSELFGNTFYGQLKGLPSSYLATNTYHPLSAPPTGTRVFVRPNIYEAGRAHVVVFNWSRAGSVNVDLSSIGLNSGDTYEIRDAQNFLGTPLATGTYNGNPIPVPMTSQAIMWPVGNIPHAPYHSESDFQVFVVRKTGGNSTPDTTSPQVTITAPSNNQTLSGTVTLSASASDSGGMDSVQFYLDGSPVGPRLTAAPYSTTLNTTNLSNRGYTLSAMARDQAGNTGSSPSVMVNVNNPVAPPPPPPAEATRSNGSPNATLPAGTTQTTMSLTTNLAATCRYGTTAGVAYGSLGSAFANSNGTSHTTTISGLTSGSTYRYFVRCQTTQGVANTTDYPIQFSVAAASTPPQSSSFVEYREAESAVLTAPMFVLDWGTASGAKYIRSNTTNQGTATLTFTVPSAGNYILWGRIYSATANNDSLWVSVDGGPEDVWDTAQNLWKGAWQWTRVTGRNANGGVPSPKNANPRVFSLSAGIHTVRFRGAETYTYLDRVLLTNDLSLIPQ